MDGRTTEWMVWTWAGWEPMRFYRRLGGFHESQEGNALWAETWYDTLHGPRTAEALADAGVNWVTTHLFKGFGLQAEAEEIARTAELIENCHACGVKVFTYIQYGTVMPETLLAEMPDGGRIGRVDWNGRHDGHPYEYGDHYWRAKACANQPGFRELVLRCVDQAVQIGADGIWIDNLNADGCHCDACQTAFRQYVRKHLDDSERQLGLRAEDLDRISIPRAERTRDPLFVLWTRCRCEETKTSIEMLAAHARQLKPDIVVAANVGIGNDQRAIPENGNWYGNLSCLDYCYAENHLLAEWKQHQGRLVTQHLPAKIAAAGGYKIVPGANVPAKAVGPYRKPGRPSLTMLRRLFAESAMLGAHALGGPYGLRGENAGADPLYVRDARFRADVHETVDFYQQHAALFAGSTDAAPVGLYYSFESLLVDETPATATLDAMHQLLLQHQLPTRVVLSDRLDVEGLALLILPHVTAMSDKQATRITKFVSAGGRVLATGRTSLYDEWGRMRVDYALADVFGTSFSDDFEEAHQHEIVPNSETGCLLLPGEWGLTDRTGHPYCQLDAETLAATIRESVAGRNVGRLIDAPPSVLFEVRRSADGRDLFCLLNLTDEPARDMKLVLDGVRPGPVRTFRVGVEGPESCLAPAVDGNYSRILAIPQLIGELFVAVG